MGVYSTAQHAAGPSTSGAHERAGRVDPQPLSDPTQQESRNNAELNQRKLILSNEWLIKGGMISRRISKRKDAHFDNFIYTSRAFMMAMIWELDYY